MSAQPHIPVLLDDRVTLSDSSVICEYLEDAYPQKPLLPRDPLERAGERQVLNLGHSLGHALESYHQLPHGVAVGQGAEPRVASTSSSRRSTKSNSISGPARKRRR